MKKAIKFISILINVKYDTLFFKILSNKFMLKCYINKGFSFIFYEYENFEGKFSHLIIFCNKSFITCKINETGI